MLATILAAFAGCLRLERLAPGWRVPAVRTWPLRLVALNAAQLGVVVAAGFTWEIWCQGDSLFGMSEALPAGAAGLAAYFVATFVFYGGHRWRHEVVWLWRHFRQIHHSPQRLEVVTSFHKHPLEMVANSLLGSVLVYPVLGLTAEAGALYALCTALGELFNDTNCRMPHRVGYVFQRPEMHRIHHVHGRHRDDHGDIVSWDMLSGTWRNPRTWDGARGFTPEREERLTDMLRFRDVHREAGAP